MRFLKSVASVSYWIYSAVMILVGFGAIILAFINSPLQLQIALGLIGMGFISLGLVQVKRAQNENRYEERLEQIITKLDEIQQKLEKEGQSKGTGVVIADVISSGLKYYADQMTRQKEEEP